MRSRAEASITSTRTTWNPARTPNVRVSEPILGSNSQWAARSRGSTRATTVTSSKKPRRAYSE